MSRDPNEGNPIDPKSLHKYLYAGADPINAKDPTGRAEEEDEEVEGLISLSAKEGIKHVVEGAACAIDIAATILADVEDSKWGTYLGLGGTIISCTIFAGGGL